MPLRDKIIGGFPSRGSELVRIPSQKMPLFEPPPQLVYNDFLTNFDEMKQNGRFPELATAAGGADFGAQKTAVRSLTKSMDTIPETAFFLPTESLPYARG